MAKLRGAVIGWEQKENEEILDYYKRQDKLLANLESKAVKGVVVNSVLQFQIADGYALYLVVKEKPLTLDHIPYGDSYEIDDAHIRGLNLSDVKSMIGRMVIPDMFGES